MSWNSSGVPNAPCGVERWKDFLLLRPAVLVPNAPCGVESITMSSGTGPSASFLMHRVELKDWELREDGWYMLEFLMHRVELKVMLNFFIPFLLPYVVPNAPCGVERKALSSSKLVGLC